MTEDWAGVARAISQRMAELDLSQRELIERSRVSKATVGELVRNSAQRRRSSRTLEALSTALNWHPHHLQAVLTGRRIPDVGEPHYSEDDIPGRLAAIEKMLGDITSRLGAVDDIRADVRTVVQLVSGIDRNSGR